MKIKEPHQSSSIISPHARKLLLNRKLLKYVMLPLLVLWSAGMFLFGWKASISRSFVGEIESFKAAIPSVLAENFRIPGNYIKGLFAEKRTITLDIKHKNVQKLEYVRATSLEGGHLVSGAGDYVNAKFTVDNQSHNVKVRLKGDGIEHLTGEKWSFRVKVSGDNTVMGMRVFSLHSPQYRNYIWEWLFHEAVRKEGLVALRYDFADVVLNGNKLGLYGIEEHFEKRLIEHSKHREGVIIRYDEKVLWDNYFWSLHDLDSSYLSSNIISFMGIEKIAAAEIKDQYMKAFALLDGFRNGSLSTSQVFDADKLTTFLALVEVFGARHGAKWNNKRFYYNPVTARLEPAAYDLNANALISTLGFESDRYDAQPYSLHQEQVFQDPVVMAQYIEKLERFSQDQYLDQFFSSVAEELENKLAMIYSEYPYFHFSRHILENNQKFILKKLSPMTAIQAFTDSHQGDTLTLRVANMQSVPVVITAVSVGGKTISATEATIVPGKAFRDPMKFQTIRFAPVPALPAPDPAAGTAAPKLEIQYHLIGLETVKSVPVYPWKRIESESLVSDVMRRGGNIMQAAFVRVNADEKKIYLREGSWVLESTVVVPEGYTLIAQDNVRFDLKNGASFISYSPVNFRAADDQPIVFTSRDQTGHGFFVLNAKEQSYLEGVQFIGLANPVQNGWSLTGAVSFYESPVKIARCLFKNNRSEDGLNIIRSPYEITDSYFDTTFSDAFDGDFSNGSILNTRFSKCGNDCIDVSGSKITASYILVDGAGDKGLSIGENSQAELSHIKVNKANIGLAGKDLSRVEGWDIEIRNSNIGTAVYQKKPEYGGSHLVLKEFQSHEVKTEHLIEENSSVSIDGNQLEVNGHRLKEILYGEKYDAPAPVPAQ